jgi:Secretion system C-terminal sorting domain
MKKSFLLLMICLCSFQINAQWQPQNPGAGGQIQSFDCDPNDENTVYLSSDVEGQYRSDDNGLTWDYIGRELQFNVTFSMTVEPGNSNRLYSSGANGVHISTDRGVSWSDIKLEGFPIAKVIVNPSNVNQIYAIVGWRYKETVPQLNSPTQSNAGFSGDRIIFKSDNKGSTWQTLTYNSTDGFRNTYSLDISPSNSSTLYLGACSGLFRSTNSGSAWTKLAQPSGTFNCFGACLSPDGNYIYASFATVNDPENDNAKTTTTTRLYVSRTNSITSTSWTALNSNGWNLGNTDGSTGTQTSAFNGAWWQPKMDPRSTATKHKILMGTASNARQGLYEGTFNYTTAGALQNYNWLRVLYRNGDVNPGPSTAFNYDPGWEDFIPGSAAYAYTPSTWTTKNGIWTTSQQNMYYGERTSTTFPYTNTWRNRYCTTVDNNGTLSETYKSRGTASTVNFDGVGYNNYIIQGQADNGILESWDSGNSWATQSKPQTTQTEAVAIANIGAGNVPIVLAHGVPNAFGGAGVEGSLYAKRLVNSDKTDVWAHVAGGTNARGALPNVVINQIAVDESNTNRVVLAMDKNGNNGGGIYEIANVQFLYTSNAVVNGGHGTTAAATSFVKNITNTTNAQGSGQAELSAASVASVQIDPNNPNVIYATAGNGFFKGNFVNSKWNWIKKLTTTKTAKLSVWDFNGITYIALAGNLENAFTGVPAGESVAISRNGGDVWFSVYDESKAETTRTPSWYSNSKYSLLAGGMVGYGNKIYCSYFTFGYNKGFGVFEGTIARNTNTNTTWKDFTNNMEFPRIRRFQINKNSNNAVFLYAAMQGTGFEKRDITPTAPATVQQIVEEPTAENLRISVFPNPTSEMVEVEIPTTEKEDVSYQVYSLQGRPFLSGKFNGNKVNLNISNLPTGIYQIRVIYADRVDTKQISVVR